MNRALPVAIAIVAAFVLQVGIAPYIAIGGAVPNFFLLVAVTIGLVQGPKWGAGAGFVGGLLFDLIGSGPVGPMALILTVVGFAAGMLSENLFAEGWLLPLTVLAVASLSVAVAYGLVLALLGANEDFWSSFVAVMLPEALYNVALGLLFYPVLARFLRQDRPMKTLRRLG